MEDKILYDIVKYQIYPYMVYKFIFYQSQFELSNIVFSIGVIKLTISLGISVSNLFIPPPIKDLPVYSP